METHHKLFEVELSSLAAIRTWVEQCTVGVDKTRAVLQLTSAIDELCANIILYRDVFEVDGKIDIKLNVGPDSISAEVISRGEEFNISSYTPRDLRDLVEKRIKGGLGIRIIQLVTDKLEYSHQDHQNRYLLVKNLD